MVPFMAQTPATVELAKTILYGLRVQNVTHKDLATHLHISPSTVSRRLEDGEFTYGQLVVIADLLGVSVVDLLPAEAAA